MKETHQRASISPEDFILAATKAIACLVTYWINTHVLSHYLNYADDVLGGNVGRGRNGLRVQAITLRESCS